MNKVDNETKKIMKYFNLIEGKQYIADKLAEEAVIKGIKQQSDVLSVYYGEYESSMLLMLSISFGLICLIPEDFYIIKEILGSEYILKTLRNQSCFLKVIK